jgi:putative flippase GtrA
VSELLRFFSVTVLGVVIDIAIAWALHTYAAVPLWLAATIGFVLAALGNYVMHQSWTFRSGPRRLSLARGVKYGAVALVTLLARIAAIAALERLWESGLAIMILIAGAGVSFFVNFALSKFFVFAKSPAYQGDQAGDRAGKPKRSAS